MVEVRKKSGETTESLIRRFTRRVQQSGVLIRAKKGRFRVSEKNKRAIRESAIRREKARVLREYLRKIGKLEEHTDQKFRKRTRRRGM